MVVCQSGGAPTHFQLTIRQSKTLRSIASCLSSCMHVPRASNSERPTKGFSCWRTRKVENSLLRGAAAQTGDVHISAIERETGQDCDVKINTMRGSRRKRSILPVIAYRLGVPLSPWTLDPIWAVVPLSGETKKKLRHNYRLFLEQLSRSSWLLARRALGALWLTSWQTLKIRRQRVRWASSVTAQASVVFND